MINTSSATIEIYTIYLFLIFSTYSQHLHYSTFNFIFLVLSAFPEDKRWHHLAMNNSIGLGLTWYVALLLDMTLPARMIDKNNWTMNKFICGDIVLHMIPLLYSVQNFKKSYLNNNTQDPLIYQSGVYTHFMNMLWCHITFRGFEPATGYVDLPSRLWNLLWLFNSFFHMLPMFLVK
jgi:hypothetical protein